MSTSSKDAHSPFKQVPRRFAIELMVKRCVPTQHSPIMNIQIKPTNYHDITPQSAFGASSSPALSIDLPKDRPFNGFRAAASASAKAAVVELGHLLINYERYCTPRKRERKHTDQAIFESQVEALGCDLIHSHLTRPGAWLSISLSDSVMGSKNRYRPQATTKKLKDVLYSMTSPEMEMAEIEPGFRSPFNQDASRLTKIRAGAKLMTIIDEYNLTAHDFKLDTFQEVVILKDTKEDRWDKGKWLQYEDTEDTIRYRDELRRINQSLQEADIEFPPTDHYQQSAVDTSNRCLRRYFNNNSFEQGGRLFGGFWQHLCKTQRRDILVDGKATVTLDYGQMVPRVLYGLAGHDPVFADAYTIPGLESYRSGVKMVFNAMLNAETPLLKKPQGSAVLLPQHMTIHEVADRIARFHEPITHTFYGGKGLYLTFKESTILMEVLTRLHEQNIIALPIHDAIMVKVDDQSAATEVMIQVFREVAGTDGLVHVES